MGYLVRPSSSISVLNKDLEGNLQKFDYHKATNDFPLPVIKLKPSENKIYRFSCLDRCCYTLTNPDYVYSFYNDLSTRQMIYLTGSGGGGAGGIGHIRGMYFISGGGGGAGCAVSNCPVFLESRQTLTIKIGKGGDSKTNEHGNRTYFKISDLDGNVEKMIILEGGKNGLPNHHMITENSRHVINERLCLGGVGGKSKLTCANHGNSGDPGILGLPSQNVATGGCGGNSFFEQGGDGGGNFLACGGLGGNKGECFNLLGFDGHWGSGGGGSCPLSNFDRPKLSGNGGNGFVKLDICCKII